METKWRVSEITSLLQKEAIVDMGSLWVSRKDIEKVLSQLEEAQEDGK